MAQATIKIEKDDIKTSKIGINIMVKIDDKFSIIFSREALDELISDYNNIKLENNKIN